MEGAIFCTCSDRGLLIFAIPRVAFFQRTTLCCDNDKAIACYQLKICAVIGKQTCSTCGSSMCKGNERELLPTLFGNCVDDIGRIGSSQGKTWDVLDGSGFHLIRSLWQGSLLEGTLCGIHGDFSTFCPAVTQKAFGICRLSR